MPGLYINRSQTASWYQLVFEAQQHAGHLILPELENYLVLTLEHFTTNCRVSSSVLAFQFLNATNVNKQIGVTQLREVGDQCLLLSGLFPERALRKNVPLSYFVDIGKSAYQTLAQIEHLKALNPEVFHQLHHHFVGLMDILNSMRQLNR